MNKNWREALGTAGFEFNRVLGMSPMGGPVEMWSTPSNRNIMEVLLRYDSSPDAPLSVNFNCVLTDDNTNTVFGNKILSTTDDLFAIKDYVLGLLKGDIELDIEKEPTICRVRTVSE